MSDWKHNIRTSGYHVFSQLVPKESITRANHAIAHDLAVNYDASRQVEYDNQSFCPGLRSNVVITDLVKKSPIRTILNEAVGLENIEEYGLNGGQIAIRQAHNAKEPTQPNWHIDGIPTPTNGVQGTKLQNFTALVGIFLTPVTQEYAGNFTVWPGSHYNIEKYFRERGRKAMEEGLPKANVGEPTQIKCQAGDIVLCHYQLAHAAAVNVSDNDRIAVFFRIFLKNINDWESLTNIRTGWKI